MRCAAFFAFSGAVAGVDHDELAACAPPSALMPPASLMSSTASCAPLTSARRAAPRVRDSGDDQADLHLLLRLRGSAGAARPSAATAAAVSDASTVRASSCVFLLVSCSSDAFVRSSDSEISAWRTRSFAISASRVPLEHDAPGLQHIAAVAGLQRLGDALLDEQDRDARARGECARSARRSGRRWSARGPSTARRASAASATTRARARSPASAARRPKACRRTASRRSGEHAETARRCAVEVSAMPLRAGRRRSARPSRGSPAR